MLAADEDALVCDFVETYGILDHRAVGLPLLATLAAGLGEDSRINRKLTGTEVSVNTFLLAGIFDRLSILCWQKTEDGRRGHNPPASVVDMLTSTATTEKTVGFDTAEEYEAYRASILGGG